MEITSFAFLCFYSILLILYYALPGQFQWILLLAGSVLFYVFSGNPYLLFFPVLAVFCSYLCTLWMEKAAAPQGKKAALILDLAVLLGTLLGWKYMHFGGNILVPIGLSFYTFALAGYGIDVYNGIAPRQKNLLKLALYGMYFPLMVSGPILLYRNDGEQFFKPHLLDYRKVTRGMQRMLWGFMKKLVISERCAMAANAVFDHYGEYRGTMIWVGILLFTFQLYTDFSGCMDIVLGLSESLGIALPENFQTPFFAKNISEYWRRWHITLGIWMKEYVFYPLLRTELFTKLGKFLRKKCGKKQGKQLATIAAMFVLWLTVGLWHGGEFKYVIGSGLLHWFYISFGMLTLPFWAKLFGRLSIPMEGKWQDRFRILRTFLLVNIGNTFFRAASSADALHMLGRIFPFGRQDWRLPPGDLLGQDAAEWIILLAALLTVLTVSVLQQSGSVRDRIASGPLPLRWGIWMGLLFFVILFGSYGPGYSSAAFIYQGF